MAELDDYNLEVLELPYYPGTERGQAETLNACFEQYGGKIDALLTIGPTEDTARRAVQRYSSAGAPVFFACDDAEGCGPASPACRRTTTGRAVSPPSF